MEDDYPDCTCPRECDCEIRNGEIVGISNACPEHGDDEYDMREQCSAEVHWWE